MQGGDVGLDPGTPGSCPELKAGAQPLSHPGIPVSQFSILALFISTILALEHAVIQSGVGH